MTPNPDSHQSETKADSMSETPPTLDVVHGYPTDTWLDKAARMVANKGNNMAFWHGSVDFSAHEIKKIIEGCYKENESQRVQGNEVHASQTPTDSAVQPKAVDPTPLIEALRRIKALVVGEKFPHWNTNWTITNTRFKIADICDTALQQQERKTQT